MTPVSAYVFTYGLTSDQVHQRAQACTLAPQIQLRVELGAYPGLAALRLAGPATDPSSLASAVDGLVAQLGAEVYAHGFGAHGGTLADATGMALESAGHVLATAESCTGGLVGHWITERPGSSRYYAGGIIAYANEIKQALLHVAADDLKIYGAVSHPVVAQMAEAALQLPLASVAVAISGIAGPSGGTLEKPVGTVEFALASREHPTHTFRRLFAGGRSLVKAQAALFALDLVRRTALEFPLPR